MQKFFNVEVVKNIKNLLSVLFILLLISCDQPEAKGEEAQSITYEYAAELAHNMIIVDTHVDLPYRLRDDWEDISKRTERGHTDYVRMAEGGLDAPFMSIYIPASYDEKGGGKELADTLIDMVNSFEEKWPDKFNIATSVAEVKENFDKGLISFPMGIENGTAIEEDLSNLEHFYNRGIRYMTLTHSKNNLIGGSSYDTERTWDGLTEFGADVVKEMNRLGMMVDISHVSDSTFWDVLEVTQTPPIASHSSCRHFTPGMERNMSDDMIKALAEKGGVIMINFGTYFINGEYAGKMNKAWAYAEEHKLAGDERDRFFVNFKKENNVPEADVKEVVAHINHVVDLVGVDHVGFGSDFDGVGDLPTGLTDVSMYPNLIYELLKAGYSEHEIEKICSGNILRVWKKVEGFAKNI